MVVVEREEKERTKEKRKELTQRTRRAEHRVKKRKETARLTTADLVLLSLLAERPMHGYQANAELVRREVQDWAGISRPQVYYSLEKLARLGMLRESTDKKDAEGPERQVYAVTARGSEALADALEREDWTTGRTRPVFLTWMALSWQARGGVFARQLQARREFLEKEIAREKETLDSVLKEVGHAHHEAVWMISLMAEQFRTELKWLDKVEREMGKRGKARNPEYANGQAFG
jgi:DNA-binding PadR family transcriptional regulator